MKFTLKSKESAIPCLVTLDDENGDRYMIRKEDTSGEVFNSPSQLIAWFSANWHGDDFVDSDSFHHMMKELDKYEE
ncbi:hypothetical protein [Priestia endophytica]|uniref:Threonine dehydratase n=1 Tax=Priestia endophytica TaxID=135735 RepID=A0AAX1Q1K9_9BACI|nr:hypothetical protein [Priestia endophytica]RAS71930.1 hypothetical protein A3864_22885 [Priestia endophytica]RAS89548.1 hypothetical protein A3863_10015 [Priestia endophytica]